MTHDHPNLSLTDRAIFAHLDDKAVREDRLVARAKREANRVLGVLPEEVGDVDLDEQTVEFEVEGIPFRYRVAQVSGEEEDVLFVKHLTAWKSFGRLAELGRILQAQQDAKDRIEQSGEKTNVNYGLSGRG